MGCWFVYAVWKQPVRWSWASFGPRVLCGKVGSISKLALGAFQSCPAPTFVGAKTGSANDPFF